MPVTNYTVVAGDTFASIASQKYKDGAFSDELARYNGFTASSRSRSSRR
jgi:nucleoid-associated protein YgaU